MHRLLLGLTVLLYPLAGLAQEKIVVSGASGQLGQARSVAPQGLILAHRALRQEPAVANDLVAELDSPHLREPSSGAVADLTGSPATSVRELLLANRERLRDAARRTERAT